MTNKFRISQARSNIGVLFGQYLIDHVRESPVSFVPVSPPEPLVLSRELQRFTIIQIQRKKYRIKNEKGMKSSVIG